MGKNYSSSETGIIDPQGALAEEARRVAAWEEAEAAARTRSASANASFAGPPPPPAPAMPSVSVNSLPDAPGSFKPPGMIERIGAPILGGLIGGPAGFAAVNAHEMAKSVPPAPPPAEAAPAEAAPAPRPEESAPQEETPLVYGGGGPGGGGPSFKVRDAGMYPHSQAAQIREGKAIPEESKALYGAATGMRAEALDQRQAADEQLRHRMRGALEMEMQANEEARASQAKLMAQRDAEVMRRMEDIQSLSAEANAKIDPNKYWTDRGAYAGIAGAIAVGLGSFGAAMTGGRNYAFDSIQSGINREIDAQVNNAKLASNAVSRKETALNMFLAQNKDEAAAVEKARLSLLDNVMLQIESYKNEHAEHVDPAKYTELRAQLLEQRGDLLGKISDHETGDVTRTLTQQWRDAQYAGGGGTGKYEAPDTIVSLPASDVTKEGETHVSVPKDVHAQLSKLAGHSYALIGINEQALKERSAAKEALKRRDIKAAMTHRQRLLDLEQQKVSALSQANGEGVTREPEFKRAVDVSVNFTDLGATYNVEKAIRAQNNMLVRGVDDRISAAGGQVVKNAYQRDKGGRLVPAPLFTGQAFKPRPIAPEMGEPEAKKK